MARRTEPWLPDGVAQVVGDWSLDRLRRTAAEQAHGKTLALEANEAEFVRTVCKALIEAGLSGPRRTGAERKETDYAFYAGLSPFSYLATPQDTRYLWSLLEREAVGNDPERTFRVLNELLRDSNARGAALRRMVLLDLGKSVAATSRDSIIEAVLEGDEGYRVDEATRREIAAWVMGDGFRAGTKGAEKRLRALAASCEASSS